jgi:hypothetical protein
MMTNRNNKIQGEQKMAHPFIQLGMLVLLATTWMIMGCSTKTAVPAENIKILAAVRTAVSFQSKKQIDRCRETIRTEVEQGRMSEKLAQELESVFELTDNDQWQQAEKKIINIQERHKPEQPISCLHDHGNNSRNEALA